MKAICGLVVVMLAVGCGDQKSATNVVDAAQPDAGRTPVERGRYIMNNLGACTFCHTPLNPDGSRDSTRLFAGVDCLFDINPVDPALPPDPSDGFGCVSSRNLTNHATGLANATGEKIKNAFRNGIRTDDKKLSPVMPYWIFHNMTDDDADAVVAYLRTVPGVDHTVAANEPPWSLYNDGTIPQAAFIVPERDIPMPAGGTNDLSAMHGRYLTGMTGLCIDCHTPQVDPASFDLDFTMTFSGGRAFPKEALGLLDPSYPPLIMTRNLTPDATGLMGWTKDEIKNAVAKGKDRMGNAVCAATHGSMISPYAGLDASDLDDIAEYVMHIPPIVNDTTTCGGPGCGNCQGPPVP